MFYVNVLTKSSIYISDILLYVIIILGDMMKNFIYILTFVLTFFFMTNVVYANASLDMQCDSGSLNEGKSTTCSLILNTDEEVITSISFNINSEVLKMDVLSGLNGVSSSSGATTSRTGSFKNGDSVFVFKLTAPSKFISMAFPISISNIVISNGSTKVNELDTYSPTININGSLPNNGDKSATLEIECPNYYIGMNVECNLILNIQNAYYNNISFKSPIGREVSFNKADYASSSSGTINGEYSYSFTRDISSPFVGKTTIGTISMIPSKGEKSISFYDVILSVSYFGASGGIITNVSGDSIKLGTVNANYTGVDRPVGLTSLTVDGANVPNFSTDNYSYTVTVNNKSKVNIQGTYLDPHGIVDGLGEVTLKAGSNTFTVTCINPVNAKDKVTYTININNVDNRSTVDTLDSLSVSSVQISFNKNTTTYNASVGSSVTSVNVSSTLTDSKASYVQGFGNRNVQLNYGKNEILIKVMAEKGNVKEYKVVIDRKDDRSKVNTLSKLEISSGTINFKPGTNDYNLTVKSDVTEVTITSSLTDVKSSYVAGFGNRKVNLVYGKNEILVKVKAENESVNTYKIVITREDNRSKVNTLKSLSITNGKIQFDSNKTYYKVNVGQDVIDVTINSELTDAKSSYVDGFGNRKVNLVHGKNEILVKVKAENESVKTYTIDVFKELPNDELKKSASIMEIESDGNNIIENDDGTYTVEVNKNVDKIDFSVDLINDNATYEIIGNENIKDGDIITIKVTSEDKSTVKEYSILVKMSDNTEEVTKEEKEQYVTMPIALGVLALGVIVFVASLIKYKKLR